MRTRLLHDLAQDLGYAIRDIRRRAGLAAVVILTTAICIAATGAASAVVHSILLRPLPFPAPDQLVRIFNSYPNAGNPRSGNSGPDFFDRREVVRSLQDVALYTRTTYVLGGARSQRVSALHVTPTFFSVLQTSPALGPGFDQALEHSEELHEMLITHGLWRSAFGGANDVIGTTAILEDEPVMIVGVLPQSFRFSTWDAQVFTPLRFSPRERSDAVRHRDWYQMIGRLSPGWTVERAQAEIGTLNRSRLAEYPTNLRNEMTTAGFRTVVRPFLADLTRDVRRPLTLLWAGVLLVLAIGAANVTNLLLIRGRSRLREFAARTALGADRGRILRQLVTESTVMALVGGLLGLLLANWSLGFLSLFEAHGIPRLHDVSVDRVVVTFVMLTVIGLGVVGGAAPSSALFRGTRSGLLHHARGGAVSRSPRPYRGLVTGQIALAFVLVMGAGLLVTSLRNLIAIDPGFDPAQVGVTSISLPAARYRDEAPRLDITQRLLDSLISVPGVRVAAVADQLPFSGGKPASERCPSNRRASDR